MTKLALRNPYLEAFNLYMTSYDESAWPQWQPRTDWTHEDGFEGAKWEQHMQDLCNAQNARKWLTLYCAWAVPSPEAIRTIADLDMAIVEVGAGIGYWAWMLQQAGVHVVAYDHCLPGLGNDYTANDEGVLWTEVLEDDEFVSARHPDRALMLCWPPYDDSMAYNALMAYKGNTLVYIGEGEGGCSSDESFWREINENWIEEKCVGIPQWYGLHDLLTIYRRKPMSNDDLVEVGDRIERIKYGDASYEVVGWTRAGKTILENRYTGRRSTTWWSQRSSLPPWYRLIKKGSEVTA